MKRQQSCHRATSSNFAVVGGDGDSSQQLRILSMPLGSGKPRYNRQPHPPTTMRADIDAMADGITPVLGKIEGHLFDTQV